ncbi:MAG: hypothetical protein Fues2KO_35620 [Fuerstiella sp.]|jgi:F0F1-type ATP synthase assembly protein I
MVDDRTTRRRDQVRKIAQAHRDAQQILSLCLSIGLCAGGGYWLDLKFGTSPLFTICGVSLGFVSAGLSLKRLLEKMDRRDQRKQDAESGKPN